MNGNEPKIEIFKPFGQAFELAKKILFQPFDLKKWCVIGFAAFLAGHFSAGGGFGFPSPIGNFQPRRTNPNLNMPSLEQWKPWLLLIILVFVILVFAIAIVITWLRSRGSLIFTDCIVRNRGAIVGPWREYRNEGNSYFLFQIAVMFASMAAVAIGAVILFSLGLFANGHRQFNSIAVVIFFVPVCVFLAALSIFIGVISYFMAPVMYVRRCRAVEAFREVVWLIAGNPAPFFLFCLFAIVLLLAMLVVGGIVSCATCCLAALPYVGTVIMLPVFVCLRAFGLLFLRQFGSDYDVWATLPPPAVGPVSAEPPTPPPLPA